MPIALAATILVLAAGAPKPAAKAAAKPAPEARRVMCVDGTTAREGKAACKEHGGVERTGLAPRKAKPAPAAAVPGRTQALKPAPALPLTTPGPGAPAAQPTPPSKAAATGAAAAKRRR
ncbi:MAG: hypothetical protein QM704_01165 [Anaeromyxobacteraceae bacterium]